MFALLKAEAPEPTLPLGWIVWLVLDNDLYVAVARLLQADERLIRNGDLKCTRGEPAGGGPIGRNAVCVDKKHVALALRCLASAGNLNGVVRRYEPTVTAHILLDERRPIVSADIIMEIVSRVHPASDAVFGGGIGGRSSSAAAMPIAATSDSNTTGQSATHDLA